METLVLKCTENAYNDSLRGMNELRVRAISTGTGASKVGIGPKRRDGTYGRVIEYRILGGTGVLYDNSNVEKGTEYDVQDSARLSVTSGESTLQIKNFDLATDVIGYEGSSFVIGLAASNYPYIVLDLKEIKNKTFLKQVYLDFVNGYYESEDIAELANLTELTYFNAVPYTSLKCGGNLASLHNLKNLVTFISSRYNKKVSFKYCINDLINMTALVNCEIYGGEFTGGDVFDLLSNKSYINFVFDRLSSKTDNMICSYISGTSDIPVFSLKTLNIWGNYNASTVYAMDLTNAKSLLTLIKDGINANKITLESGAVVRIGLTSAADSALNTLASEVTALGATVTLFS